MTSLRQRMIGDMQVRNLRAPYPSRLRSTSLVVRPPFPPIAGRPRPRGDPRLSTIFDQRTEIGAQFHPAGRRRPPVPLQSHPAQALDVGRRHPDTQKAPDLAGRVESRRGPAVSGLRAGPEAPHPADDLLCGGLAHLGGHPAGKSPTSTAKGWSFGSNKVNTRKIAT